MIVGSTVQGIAVVKVVAQLLHANEIIRGWYVAGVATRNINLRHFSIDTNH